MDNHIAIHTMHTKKIKFLYQCQFLVKSPLTFIKTPTLFVNFCTERQGHYHVPPPLTYSKIFLKIVWAMNVKSHCLFFSASLPSVRLDTYGIMIHCQKTWRHVVRSRFPTPAPCYVPEKNIMFVIIAVPCIFIRDPFLSNFYIINRIFKGKQWKFSS